MQAARQVGLCGLCDCRLTPAEKALGLAFCEDCAYGWEKAKPAQTKRPSRAWKVLGDVAFAILFVAGMVALFLAVVLLGGRA